MRNRALLVAPALALALVTAFRLPAAWESGNALNHVSGTWMTLADDFTRGTLYRPIHAAGAWGGTRYFPLVFALQGGLMRMGMSPVEAAYATSLSAGVLLALGLLLLLRRLGAPRYAAALAPVALAGFASQHALTSGRGDLLPVALSALALAAIARGPVARTVPAAALLLSLAFAAKPTALTAAAAGAVYLAIRRQRRAALALAALVAAGGTSVLAATDALSGGRFLANLRAVAAGGADVHTALRAPVRLAEELAIADPAGLVLCVAATVALAATLKSLRGSVRARASTPFCRRGPAPAWPPPPIDASAAPRTDADGRLLPALWLVASWAGALAVLGSPGTGVNHLVEAEAASAAFLSMSATTAPGRPRAIARAGALLSSFAGLALAAALWRADLASSRLADIREITRALPPGPVLSEDPLVPLLAGRRPVLLDAFALRLVGARDPGVLRPLSDALERGEYAAIVLLADPRSPAGEAWYADGNLGLGIAREIGRAYRPAAVVGRYRLNLPGPRAETPGMARRDDGR